MKEPLTYGNWRKPVSPGLGKLSGAATAILFGGLVLTFLTQLIAGWLPAVFVFAVAAAIFALFEVRDRDGLTVIDRLGEIMAFRKAKRTGSASYRSGVTGVVPTGTAQIPGIAANLLAKEFEDSFNRPFAVLGGRGTYTVAFTASPDGESLVDPEQVDIWVAMYGHWLASLGEQIGLVGAQVIVESAPDPGTRLRQEILSHVVQSAPELSRNVLDEVQVAYPAGSATVKVYVTLTYRSSGRSIDDFGRDMQTVLPSLSGGLANTGAGVVYPATISDLARAVRSAYDPAASALFDEAVLTGQEVVLDWGDVGPLAHEAGWDFYRHDSGVSVTWEMTNAPQGIVQSNVLKAILAPHSRIARKRVALMYRPIDISRTAAVAEADQNQARARAVNQSRPTARALTELAKAERTAQEEASGAGLVNFGLVVTATGTSESELTEIRSTVNSLAPASRIRVRPAYGAQDAAFATALPLGIVPMMHAKFTATLREQIG